MMDILPSEGPPKRVFGVVMGIVSRNDDPDGLGRLKVRLPTLGSGLESAWAPLASFWAGKQSGAFFLPELNDEVLVVFRDGNIDEPYVIGSVWNGSDKPPVAKQQQRFVREFRTRSGSTIRFDESKGAEKIEVLDRKRNNFVIDTAKNTITIKSSKDIVLSAPGKISIEAGQMVIRAKTSAVVEAKTSIKLDTTRLDAKGKQVNLG